MNEPPPTTETARAAPGRSPADNWRRFWRRSPDVHPEPVDLHQAVALGLSALAVGAVVGVALVLLIPYHPPTLVLLATVSPVLHQHAEGVRHRWWALAVGLATGVAAGLGLAALLETVVGSAWATLWGLLLGSAVGILTHAGTTHLPVRTAR
ncbi:hypothetical protein [Verrucosispora sp. NA02020]|uniref:hypothetical protein n=1 Tax=Verrucosispora sp. NA02020 TaxID=2742132 RepID=UPI001590789C|nr:hypothetical protein [Verrucosispora sp. NA02020]QKW14198.1 hypothetical protein HUT12_16355 [Verrucosispora sp. NA02020]